MSSLRQFGVSLLRRENVPRRLLLHRLPPARLALSMQIGGLRISSRQQLQRAPADRELLLQRRLPRAPEGSNEHVDSKNSLNFHFF